MRKVTIIGWVTLNEITSFLHSRSCVVEWSFHRLYRLHTVSHLDPKSTEFSIFSSRGRLNPANSLICPFLSSKSCKWTRFAILTECSLHGRSHFEDSSKGAILSFSVSNSSCFLHCGHTPLWRWIISMGDSSSSPWYRIEPHAPHTIFWGNKRLRLKSHMVINYFSLVVIPLRRDSEIARRIKD